ncbi:MAG TPA: hypothetical protein VNM46_12265, partial [Xanthobacteraceae bacterium]|nr:hypothetical protein [Xanthobacteraceae bacterium]
MPELKFVDAHTQPNADAYPAPQAWQDFVNFALIGPLEILHFARFIKRNSTLFAHLVRLAMMSGAPVINVSRQPSFALLFGLAWLLIVVQLLANDWANTARALGDTDDAMRLAQLRDWLSGQGWYDLSQTRVAGGYESHW